MKNEERFVVESEMWYYSEGGNIIPCSCSFPGGITRTLNITQAELRSVKRKIQGMPNALLQLASEYHFGSYK